jgi:predicted DsbA family dithiol-disulfide isomerase
LSALRFVVYSDYLCPWCFNASVRLRRLEAEYAGQVELEWRSYLLRPEPRVHSDPKAALAKFRSYTESWMRPAAEQDAGEFRVWASDQGPPSHSIPAHRVAKAAQRVGPEAFSAMHEGLLKAYFSENRDISEMDTLRSLWHELSLPADAFESSQTSELLDEVLADHREALDSGATGVPAVRLAGNPAVIVGAHPIDLYRRWVDRSLERLERAEGAGSE